MPNCSYPANVLQISDDRSLAESRSRVLRTAGWRISTCRPLRLVPDQLARYDVLLFCQTVPSQLVSGVSLALSEHSPQSTGILRIAWADEARFSPGYVTLVAPVSPADLIERTRALLERRPAHVTGGRTRALRRDPIRLHTLLSLRVASCRD